MLAALAALILIPLGLIPLAAVEPSAPALYALAISVMPAAASATDIPDVSGAAAWICKNAALEMGGTRSVRVRGRAMVEVGVRVRVRG